MKLFRLEYSQEQGCFHKEFVDKIDNKNVNCYQTICESMDNENLTNFIERMHKKYPALAIGSQMKTQFPTFDTIKEEFHAH